MDRASSRPIASGGAIRRSHGVEDDVLRRADRAEQMHAPPRRSGWILGFEETPGHHRDGRLWGAREYSGKMDAMEEGNMTVEDEDGIEQTVDAEESDIDDATPDLPDDVEAHIWRAQS
jgi:hypothetical protein